MRIYVLILGAILSVIQYNLWFGHNGYMDEQKLLQNTKELQDTIGVMDKQNSILKAEIHDLKTNFNLIESIARHDLNLQRPDEIFIYFNNKNRLNRYKQQFIDKNIITDGELSIETEEVEIVN